MRSNMKFTTVQKLTIFLCGIGILATSYVSHLMAIEDSALAFKQGCMMEGGSLQLCNVASDEFKRILKSEIL